MVNILPIPSNLLIFHGIFKLICAGLGLIFTYLLFLKYLEKKSRIAFGFVFVFINLILGNVFSSFDNLLGWDHLLGPETWLGYGLGQIFSSLATVGYFGEYIEVFKVKEQWTSSLKQKFLLFTIVELVTAVFMLTYYVIGFPSDLYIPTGINLVFTLIVYFAWLEGTTRLLKSIEDPIYKRRFQYFRKVAISFIIVMFFLALSALCDQPSFVTWVGLLSMILGMYFGYKAILSS